MNWRSIALFSFLPFHSPENDALGIEISRQIADKWRIARWDGWCKGFDNDEINLEISEKGMHDVHIFLY